MVSIPLADALSGIEIVGLHCSPTRRARSSGPPSARAIGAGALSASWRPQQAAPSQGLSNFPCPRFLQSPILYED